MLTEWDRSMSQLQLPRVRQAVLIQYRIEDVDGLLDQGGFWRD